MRIRPGRTVLATCVRIFVAFAVLTPVAAGPAIALPPGKAWSPVVDTFKIPGHTYGLLPTRLETDATGSPLAFAEALGGIGQDMYVLRWADKTWLPVAHLGYGTGGVRPVPSPPGTHHLIWPGLKEIETPSAVVKHLVMSELVGESLTTPDTIALVSVYTFKHAAAVSPVRRWAAVGDGNLGDDLRVFYSDVVGAWTEVPVPEGADRGVAVTVLDDTTALFAWRDDEDGPGAAMLRGTEWIPVGAPPILELNSAAPRFRARPSGGHWLSWATISDHVGIASYRDGAWSPPESLRCAYLRPESHYSQSPAAMSQDQGEYPAVAWMIASSRNGLTSVCVCVPDDSGFPVAENLEHSEQGISPEIARDRNGDVWVAWWAPLGMGWVHTYTRATASAPTVRCVDGKCLVTWALSEPAPGSWWAVLKADAAGSFQEVARVRAGVDPVMHWSDLGEHSLPLSYRIRRECVDTRYQWISDSGGFPLGVPPDSPAGGQLLLAQVSPNPSGRLIRFEVRNAVAGALDVCAYDLGGRLLVRRRQIVEGSGSDTIEIDLTRAMPRGTGLYFLRVSDASGRVAPAVKFVVLT